MQKSFSKSNLLIIFSVCLLFVAAVMIGTPKNVLAAKSVGHSFSSSSSFSGSWEDLGVLISQGRYNSNGSIGFSDSSGWSGSIAKSNYVWKGKQIKPRVTFKYKNKKLKKGKDYTVTYKNNVNIGEALAVVNFKGEYKKEKSFPFPFKIVPPNMKSVKTKATKNAILIKWKKQPAESYWLSYWKKGTDIPEKSTKTTQDVQTIRLTKDAVATCMQRVEKFKIKNYDYTYKRLPAAGAEWIK